MNRDGSDDAVHCIAWIDYAPVVWVFNAQQQLIVILVNRDEYHITFDCAIVVLESGC
jgi:hypothetical protein